MKKSFFMLSFLLFMLSFLVIICCNNDTETTNNKNNTLTEKEDYKSQLKEKGYLIFGVDDIELPWIYHNQETNTYEGFEYELATMLANELGLTAKFVSAEWSLLPSELTSDKFDVILNAYSEADVENPDMFEWSIGYQEYGYLPVIRYDDNRITDLESIKDKKVVTYIDIAEYVSEELGIKDHIVTENTNLAYEKLEKGEVDVFIYDSISVNYVLKSNHKLKTIGDLIEPSIYKVIAKKGKTSLIDAINKALEKILNSEEYKEKLKKWL